MHNICMGFKYLSRYCYSVEVSASTVVLLFKLPTILPLQSMDYNVMTYEQCYINVHNNLIFSLLSLLLHTVG